MPLSPQTLSRSQKLWLASAIEAGSTWEVVTARLQQEGFSQTESIQLAEEALARRRRVHRAYGVFMVACGAGVMAATLGLLLLMAFSRQLREYEGAREYFGYYIALIFPWDLGLIVWGLEEFRRCGTGQPT